MPLSYPAETDDLLFAGSLKLVQPARGHRAGTDAVLLAAATPPDALSIADLGAASGVVGLRAAQMNRAARVVLFERAPLLVGMARRNIVANGLAGRVEASEGDIFQLGREKACREAFDCVLSNPPFRDAARSRRSDDALKADAHVMAASPRAGESGLEGWLRNTAAILAPGGICVMIHETSAVEAVLAAMGRRFGALRLRFIHPDATAPAIRLLVAGRKGTRAPLQVLPPLVLNKNGGGFTEETAAFHAGTKRLSFEQ